MQQMTPQMMGYDRAITVFSPDGRLFQVHYAQEAVRRGATVMGLKSKDGIAMLVDKRISTKLLEAESIEKIFKIDDHIGAVASGLVADGRALVDRARVEAQVNHVTYDEPISIEVLAKKISDHIQTFTQYGGVRPYGSALLLAGIDETGQRLFETDPSGALYEYKAVSIGANRNTVMELLENQLQHDHEHRRGHSPRHRGAIQVDGIQGRNADHRDRHHRRQDPEVQEAERERSSAIYRKSGCS